MWGNVFSVNAGQGTGSLAVQYKFTEYPEKTEKTRPAEAGPRAGQGSGGGGWEVAEVAGDGAENEV